MGKFVQTKDINSVPKNINFTVHYLFGGNMWSQDFHFINDTYTSIVKRLMTFLKLQNIHTKTQKR